MKNIFKLMGIALLSCSLMVACGEDDPVNPTPDTPVNPTPDPTPTPTEGTYTLKIDNENNTWPYVKALHMASQQAWGFSASASYENEQVGFPYFVAYLLEGTNQQQQPVLALAEFFQGDNLPKTELYYEGALQSGNETIGDYMLWDIPSFDFGTFDATTHTTTFNYTIEFIDYVGFGANYNELSPGQEAINAMTDAEWNAFLEQCANGVPRKNVQFATNNYVFQAQ